MTEGNPSRPLPNPGWGPLSALPGNPLMWVLVGAGYAAPRLI